jgi:2-polyprenyl-6-methoxyphenol hydroxylase-like FAD-dependent oxidoreductase
MSAENSNSQALQTTCCIVGGGPAGMVLGFLLARSGVDVQVLEKHADFLRDFRGDTIHPSTFELIYELGILEDFLRRPHQELTSIAGVIDDTTVTIADFSHLPTHCKFVGLMPQWEFRCRKSSRVS